MNASDLTTLDDLTPNELARSFSVVLRQWLSDTEISRINAANAASGYDASSCASHDYCDANMAMLEAVSSSTGIPIDSVDVVDARFCELSNEAWAIAKRAGFNAGGIV